MSGSDVEVIVVGAGIAGLAAARDLAVAGMSPLVVDANPRPGGVMQTDAIEGYRVERGPNTFQAKAPLCAFASRHQLWHALRESAPESRRRSIFRHGRLIELPHGPGGAITTPLLSTRAKLRVLAEPFVRRGDPSGESVHAFVRRRLGAEVASEVVGAFLTGVYAGDERELGVEAVFPALVEFERSYGSLVRGGIAMALGSRASRRAGPDGVSEPARRGTWSGGEGMGALAETLAAGLPQPVRQQTRARALRRDGGAWRVALSGPDGEWEIRARHAIVAIPAFAAASLLDEAAPEAARGLAGIDYAPIVAVGLGAVPSEVRGAIEGFGFIVPRSAGVKLLGCLFMSRLFPGRAPQGHELLHCMLGGVRWPDAVRLADDLLLEQLLADLDRSLGLRSAPQILCVRRTPRAIPQPGTDHVRRIEAIERRLAQLPGLVLAGSFLAGVSVADTLATGARAAASIARKHGAPRSRRAAS